MQTRLGKIEKVSVGLCGYQDSQLGILITLGCDKHGWGVESCKAFWGNAPREGASWTIEDQRNFFGDTFLWIGEILKSAKKKSIAELEGVPVEVTFENHGLVGDTMVSWRVLTEVL